MRRAPNAVLLPSVGADSVLRRADNKYMQQPRRWSRAPKRMSHPKPGTVGDGRCALAYHAQAVVKVMLEATSGSKHLRKKRPWSLFLPVMGRFWLM